MSQVSLRWKACANGGAHWQVRRLKPDKARQVKTEHSKRSVFVLSVFVISSRPSSP